MNLRNEDYDIPFILDEVHMQIHDFFSLQKYKHGFQESRLSYSCGQLEATDYMYNKYQSNSEDSRKFMSALNWISI